jgi:spore coat protein CotH
MKSHARIAALAATTLLLPTGFLATAVGQDGPPGPPRGERQGGREMPGEAPPAGMMDFGLLLSPAVREELKLSEAQRTKLEAMEPMDDVLSVLDEKQRARFAQIRLQAQGPSALMSESLGKSLEITKEQRGKLEELLSEGHRMFLPPEERANLLAKALAVLTDAQRTKYTELTGAPIQIEPMGFGPPPFGGPNGPGGPGGPGATDRKLVKEFDKDGNKRLDRAERDAARAKLKEERANGGGRRRMGPPGGPGGESQEAKPGERIAQADVKPASGGLYEPGVVRTLFFDFDDADWLQEMGEFYGTDVEVPATLSVDGKQYKDVGVSYRGASSFFTVGETQKRSMSVSIDFGDEKQRLLGHKSLNLLNAHEDPSLLHSVLYLTIAGKYIPAPKVNLVRVVVNGENWGIYTNAQQFNKEMLAEHFKSAEGARWKVSGSPQARGGLEYLGEDIDLYRGRFEIKSKDDDASWRALIKLCKTLNETPTEELEAALAPMLDIDSLLWFLAIDVTFVNNDGYWVRSSDYHLFLDEKGVFHVIPHDANETFGMSGGGGPGGPGGPRGQGGGAGGPPNPGREGGERGRGPNGEVPVNETFAQQDARRGAPPEGSGGGQNGPPRERRGGRRGGPGGPGGMRLGGPTLDPLVGLDDPAKPLRSKLLKVPSLQRRYLEHVRELATVWLDWNGKFGDLVKEYHALIRDEVARDTKKLSTTEAFNRQLERSSAPAEGERRRGGTLRDFAEQRREFLLNHQAIKSLGGAAGT